MKLRAYDKSNDRVYYSEDYADMSRFINECEALLSAVYEVIYQRHIGMADKYNCPVYEGMEVRLTERVGGENNDESSEMTGVVEYDDRLPGYVCVCGLVTIPVRRADGVVITKEKGF